MSPRPRLLLGGLALGLAAATVSMLPQTMPSSAGQASATGTVSAQAAACTDSGSGSDASGSRLRPGAKAGHDANELSTTQVASVERASSLKAMTQGLRPNTHGRLARSSSAKAAFKPVTVPVYWHTVTDGKAGKVSSATIAKQIAVLNAAYKNAGFTFKLTKTDTTVNKDWFNTTGPDGEEVDGDAADARAMKTKLHKGTRAALNLYSVKFSDGTLGYSSFPWAGLVSLDGTVVDYRSLPGSTATDYEEYSLGDTATHEVGHWMGLYHTFQGGCSTTRGDYVADTPAESEPQFVCEARDSCASAGTDPIHNFMDYSPDACMTTFTKGQNTRMQNKWLTYRTSSASKA